MNSSTLGKRIALLAASFMLVSCLAYSSILKMLATCSSETSVDFQRTHGVISQKIELLTGYMLGLVHVFYITRSLKGFLSIGIRPQVGSGIDTLEINTVAVNKFSKHSWIANKGWSKWFGAVLQNRHCKNCVTHSIALPFWYKESNMNCVIFYEDQMP
jgi:hypothetical protein